MSLSAWDLWQMKEGNMLKDDNVWLNYWQPVFGLHGHSRTYTLGESKG